MNAWTRFKLDVRRQETPFHARVYTLAKAARGVSVPVVPGLHSFLYSEWATRTSAWHNFWRIVYYEPMFKAKCRAVGPGFKLWYAGNGICRILGNLNIYLGAHVHTFDSISLTGLRVFDEPELHVGDHTYLGPRLRLLVAKRVDIGSRTIIGGGVTVADNPGHPQDAADRLTPGGGLPPAKTVRPVSIGDYCFLGEHCFVYPGATVGDGVFARAGTHLRGEVPPFSVVAGQDCRVAKLLPIPPELRELAGEERARAWDEQRERFRQTEGEHA